MLGAVRSTIRHALNWADRSLRPTVAVDTFNEFQLRDIGLTRDHESIRARVRDTAVPWLWPTDGNPRGAQRLQTGDQPDTPPAVTASPRAQPGENKDLNISLCD